jgi:hypothetical protein
MPYIMRSKIKSKEKVLVLKISLIVGNKSIVSQRRVITAHALYDFQGFCGLTAIRDSNE